MRKSPDKTEGEKGEREKGKRKKGTTKENLKEFMVNSVIEPPLCLKQRIFNVLHCLVMTVHV